MAIFNRASEGGGNAYWQDQANMASAATAMLATTDAQDYFGDSLDTNQAFIEHIYLNTLAKDATEDEDGIAYWVGLLDDGTATRGEVVAGLVSSVESYGSDGANYDATDTATVAAYNQFTNRVEVSDYMADTVEEAPEDYATSTAFDGDLTVTDAADTVTSAKASVDALAPVAGESFTLTTSADTPAMTTGDDTVDGSTVGTLNSGDVIIDQSTTDSDVLDATIATQDLAPTLKNIEKVNLTWTSNADFDFDASNAVGNTFYLTATGLAFSGNYKIDEVGTNDIVADSTIIGLLEAEEVVNSTIDAGAATSITLTEGIVTTVGAKSTADITVNNNITALKNGAAEVEKVILRASKDDVKVTLLTGDQITETLTVAGDKSMIIANDTLSAEKIINELTAGTLTVQVGDAGAVDTSKIDADTIQFTAAATAITVADDQNFLVKSAANAALASFAQATGVTNATVNLKSQMGSTAITALDISGISTLNLDVSEDTTITVLTVDVDNNVVVTGSGNFVLSDISEKTVGSDAISIDASELTGKFTITTADDAVMGVIGSSTAKNTITMTNTVNNATIITGSAGDVIDASTITTASAKFSTGAGDDTVTIDGTNLTTGKLEYDGGTGTDTLVIGGDISTATKFDLTSVENLTIDDASTLAAWMLTGETYSIKSDAADKTLNVDVTNPTGLTSVTTDLSGLVFSTSTSSNFSSVVVTGDDGVADVITGSSMDDTITPGGGDAKDIIDLGTAGGNDIVIIAADDSTYTSDNDFMDSITNFVAGAVASGGDKLEFATPGTVGDTGSTDVDVSGAISGGTGAETVVANISNGILSISGIDSGAIDTLSEWMTVAETTLEDDGAAAAGETVAFAFDGNTYVYHANTVAAAAITGADIIELVGVSGVAAVGTGAAAASTVFVG